MYKHRACMECTDACLWCRTGLGEDRNAMSAFLFTFPSGDTSKPAEKLVKVSLSPFVPNV